MSYESKLQPEDPPGSCVSEWQRGYETGKEAGYKDAIKEVVGYIKQQESYWSDIASQSKANARIRDESFAAVCASLAERIEAREHLKGGDE